MSLETEVAALTVATTNLLSAVNISKGVLDIAVQETQDLADQVGNVAVVTASGTVTLLTTSATYQLIDPNGANRDVTLPAPGALDRVVFAIKNTGTGFFTLNVKTAGAVPTGPAIEKGYSLALVWSGTKWEVL